MQSSFPPVSPLQGLIVSSTTLLSVWLLIIIRRVWLHPLSRYPGPKLWAASRIPYVVSFLTGRFNQDMVILHQKYGEVIRVAPNEISFATEEAWRDIYMHRPGHKEAQKDPIWYYAPNNMPQNIVTTADIRVRARMRRLLSPSFNEQSLIDQAPVLESYGNKMMYRLKEINENSAAVNISDWVTFFTVDIIGDLALGESFHCLETQEYHPWVRTLFSFLKGMVLMSTTRFFPLVEFILQYMLPKDVIEKQRAHTEFTNSKILQRLELKQSRRSDFLTPSLKEMDEQAEKMTLGEIQSTFAVLIVAGSESTVTSLCGILNNLALNDTIQARLGKELSRFASEEEITVQSTSSLEYLDAVIMEGLRLCYPVPGGIPRLVPEGGDVYAGNYLPEATAISIRPYVILNSEKYFHQPRKYCPERWLPEPQRPQEFASDRLSASQPFSMGPARCLGKQLAMAEMRLLLAKIVWYFKVSPGDERFDWESQRMGMGVERKPLWLKLNKRRVRDY